MTKDGKALFLRRTGGDRAGHWAFPGGMVEDDEEIADAARREAIEEVGRLSGWDLAPLHRDTTDKVDFTTFGQPVATEFEPLLNDEHDAFEWRDPSDPPKPLHPGVASLLAKFFGEEAEEADHGSSAAEELRRKFAKKAVGATDSALHLAFDKGSVRSFDSDGRMRVSITNISKANICPYKGEEIPGWEELGLERDKVYEMFRDPLELQAAAPTFNGIQILKKHVPVDVNDHQMWDIVGCTGTDAKFDGTYLTNSLSIWTKEGIDFIESGDQRELSCGYHYVPDMTPGSFGGKRYDGVMRSIEGNHVALVEEGRAGHDVVVGDSALDRRKDDMKKPTRLEEFFLVSTARAVNPLLAKDAKVEYGPIFKGLNTKNYKKRIPVIYDEVKKATKGKTIAQDASLEHVKHFLDTFEHTPHAEKSWDESVSGPQHRAMEAAAHGHSNLGIPKGVGKEFEEADKGKKFGDMIRDWASAKDWSAGMSDDDYAALDKMHMDAMTPLEEGAALDKEKDDGEEEEVNIEVGESEDAEISQSEGEEEAEDDEIEQTEEEEEAEDRHRGGRDRRSARDRRGARDKHARDKHARDRRRAAMDKTLTVDEMTKAINVAVATNNKRIQGTLEALSYVRPFVGEVKVDMANDSAATVYRRAAKIMKIEDADTVHPSALKQLIKMAGAQTMAQDSRRTFEEHEDELAMDDAEMVKLEKMFPGMMRIGQV